MNQRELIQSVRGMHDLMPGDAWAWRRLHDCFAGLARSYGCVYARTPLVEKAQLFERSAGQTSDIVTGEMYRFMDRGGDDLCLRPEGTASMVRSGLQHRLIQHGVRRFYYDGAMFRRERPQKGRYRQFHQVGVEVFGDSGYWVELELLLLTRDFLAQLGLKTVSLFLNTLGSREELAQYRLALFEYFSDHREALSETDRARLDANPLRILDSKHSAAVALTAQAPTIESHLGAQSRSRFAALCAALDEFSCPYTVQPRLVRGLEYYSHTVFEWVATEAGQAQNTLIAGGRYDELSTMIGARDEIPACGFAAGVERLLELAPAPPAPPSLVSLVADGDECCRQMAALATRLRANVPATYVCDYSERRLAAKLKDPAHCNADLMLVMGERERATGAVMASFPSGRLTPPGEAGENRILLELASIEPWLRECLPSGTLS